MVVVLVGVLLVPLLRMTGSTLGTVRYKSTQAALETARDALIAYAATHNGCLPYAADYEGSLPDTAQDGVAVASYADAGVVRKKENKPTETQAVYAGDLPWRELGLGSDFLDGDGLRIQYYVAKPYTTELIKPNDVGDPVKPKERICPAGFRGFEWEDGVVYKGTSEEPVFVYYDVTDGIVELTATLPFAGSLPINGSLMDEASGYAIVENELQVTVKSTANDMNARFFIEGTDKNGKTADEMISQGAGPATDYIVMTNNKFLIVTDVVISNVTQTNGNIEVGMDADRQLHWIFYDSADALDPTPTSPDRGGVGLTVADWDTTQAYLGGTKTSPFYIFHQPAGGARELYMFDSDNDVGEAPKNKNKVKRSRLLKDSLLEVRRGPDVINGTAAETAVVSIQNVFVLIATGANRNGAALIKVDGNEVSAPRYNSRDTNHVEDNGNDWLIYEEMGSGEIKGGDVDKVIFSMTRNTGEADEADNGDDTLLVMSFAAFRAAMSKYGMNMEPICFEKC